MIRLISALALAVFFTMQPPVQPPSSAGPGWRPLFDGKTTAGWRGFKKKEMPDGWSVIDGALTRGGKAGDIVSIDQFGDFELTLDWKIAAGANSGLFYRVVETPDAGPMWQVAPEYQLIDDRGYKGPLKDTQKTAANYDLQPPGRDATRPAGSWNTTRIVVNGSHVEHWLNGGTDRQVRAVDRRVEGARREEQVQGPSAVRARARGAHRHPGSRRLGRVPQHPDPRDGERVIFRLKAEATYDRQSHSGGCRLKIVGSCRPSAGDPGFTRRSRRRRRPPPPAAPPPAQAGTARADRRRPRQTVSRAPAAPAARASARPRRAARRESPAR